VQVPSIAIARADEPIIERLGARQLLRVVGVDEDREVEVAVADVADDRREQAGRVEVALVSAMHSASREIGTQASVVKPCAPGRSARPAS
jgi:hypothetical protein